MAQEPAPVVLITGCSSGIGRATARRFHSEGWRVWATSRDPDDIANLGEAGCRTAALDVTEEQQISAVVDALIERDNRLDCLVNNAGFGQAGAIEEVPIDRLRQQFDVNVFGPVRLAQAVLPNMRATGGGTVVNVSSLLGRVTFPMRGAYAGSKHALEAVSGALRAEVAGQPVDVVLVEPGSVRTSFGDRLQETQDRTAAQPEYDRLRRVVDTAQRLSERTGLAPARVAEVIYGAAVAEDPQRRYLVGRDARFAVLADRVVPTGLMEWLYRKLS